ncbi:uncharacterized protein LOC135709943 [Ochlerotatus camptorhynchus]|uniref:uncharacterized protein LOC135709943 n=1 Tax=Ochlerotatus camptorhynchus TaxID=644619 RepID=UPI0031DEEDC0
MCNVASTEVYIPLSRSLHSSVSNSVSRCIGKHIDVTLTGIIASINQSVSTSYSFCIASTNIPVIDTTPTDIIVSSTASYSCCSCFFFESFQSPSPSQTASPPQSPLQPMNDSTDDSDTDDGSKDEKYAKLLAKHQKQAEMLKASRKKNVNYKLQLAEMKDLVVHAVAEAKKARMGENENTTFQPDPDINMPVTQIENINGISKSVASFAQNLASHLYGAQNLQERSVEGRSSNRMKNVPNDNPIRPGISPKKLEFIYAKARERVALEVGLNNLGQIKTLSHESVVNKAIAEKIANLRKAAKNSERRINKSVA